MPECSCSLVHVAGEGRGHLGLRTQQDFRTACVQHCAGLPMMSGDIYLQHSCLLNAEVYV